MQWNRFFFLTFFQEIQMFGMNFFRFDLEQTILATGLDDFFEIYEADYIFLPFVKYERLDLSYSVVWQADVKERTQSIPRLSVW